MWHLLVYTLALTGLGAGAGAGADAPLEIVDVTPTYGHLGAPRAKGTGMLPGDVAHVSFGVKNLRRDKTGRVAYSIAIQIHDAAGKLLYEQRPYLAAARDLFGGDTLPAAARVELPLDLKPGPVSWVVTVHDRTADKSATLKGQGKALPADFGVVRVGTFADAEERVPVAPVGVVGNTLYVGLSAVGFGRNQETGRPDLRVRLRVLDEQGRSTSAAPLTGEVTGDLPADLRLIPMQFALTLTRAGQFTAEVTAEDRVSGKTATVALPIRAVVLK